MLLCAACSPQRSGTDDAQITTETTIGTANETTDGEDPPAGGEDQLTDPGASTGSAPTGTPSGEGEFTSKPAEDGMLPTWITGCLGRTCVEKLPAHIKPDQVVKLLNTVVADARELSATDKINEDPSPVCHDMAHEIGHRAAHNAAQITDLPQLQTIFCGFGYQHGVLEGWANGKTPNVVLTEGERFCNTYRDRPNIMLDCAHGLGHAISISVGEKMSDAMILCEKLDPALIEECLIGVFMTHTTSWRGRGPLAKTSIELDRPEDVCSAQRGLRAEACWWYFIEMATAAKYDSEKLAQVCSELTDSGAKQRCHTGLGWMLLRETAIKPEAAASRCEIAGDDADWCRAGVGEYLALWWVAVGRTPMSLPKICTELRVPATTGCEAAVKRALLLN